MTGELVLRRLFQASFFSFALFVPFSIAGMNFAFGFGALAWIISFFAFRGARSRPSSGGISVRQDPMLLASVLLVVSAIPSVLMSQDSSRATTDWLSYWELLIYFLVAANVLAVRMREVAFWALVAAATLSCVGALIERGGGLNFWFLHIPARYRVSSTLYPMTLAGILYQLIMLNCAVLLTTGMKPRWRFVLGAGTAVQVAALMLTMTRGAWLALAVGLVALCMLVRRRALTLVAVGLMAALVLFSLVNFHSQGRSIPELARSGLDRDAATRVVLWDIAWDLFREHPLLGVGMGDYTIEADKLLAGRSVTTTVDTHNVYLHILATRGLVGFVPFLFFWVALFRSLCALKGRLEKGSLDYQYVVGATAAAIAVLVGALTELNIDDGEVFMAFMFIMGLALSRAYAGPAVGTESRGS